MRHSEVSKNIGNKVTLNGSRDLAFFSEFKKYIYRKYIFTIIKVCKNGSVYIQCDNDKHFLAVGCRNLDLIENIVYKCKYETEVGVCIFLDYFKDYSDYIGKNIIVDDIIVIVKDARQCCGGVFVEELEPDIIFLIEEVA